MSHTTTPARSGLRRSRWAALIALFAAISLATPALAVTGMMGNDATDRDHADTFANFTIVDTNNPAPFDGYFTSVDFYAERPGVVRFVMVDSQGTVTWVSDLVEASIAGAGSFDLGEPVGVVAGSNLGVYSVGQGVISFEYNPDASRAVWEASDSGLPTVGDSLDYVSSGDAAARRIYSMQVTIEASSPQICKNGGWEGYGYKNQGQCIASVVAHENSGH